MTGITKKYDGNYEGIWRELRRNWCEMNKNLTKDWWKILIAIPCDSNSIKRSNCDGSVSDLLYLATLTLKRGRTAGSSKWRAGQLECKSSFYSLSLCDVIERSFDVVSRRPLSEGKITEGKDTPLHWITFPKLIQSSCPSILDCFYQPREPTLSHWQNYIQKDYFKSQGETKTKPREVKILIPHS